MWKWLPIYLFGFAITLAGFAISGAHVNDMEEVISILGFCVFWPLTWAYLALAFLVLFLLGWRGGPIW